MAAVAALGGPSAVLVSDDSTGSEVRSARRTLAKRGIAFTDDPAGSLDRVRLVVKSPGIAMDHPVIAAAGAAGSP